MSRRPEALAPEAVIAALPSWELSGGRIHRSWTFTDFRASLAFVTRVAACAESLHHHPDIQFGWGYVRLSLWTHDAQALTDLDVALARQIDLL
jgi:4a-hydroxytetrahydrobiopterin dehydratase